MIVNNYDSESETLQYLDGIAAQGIFGVYILYFLVIIILLCFLYLHI